MDTRTKTLLITGATGFIGGHVVEAALVAGHDVRTLSRRDWIGRPFVPVRNRSLGAFPFQIPEAAFEGVDAVIHLANTMGSEGLEAARTVNVEGTRVLMHQAEKAGVRKIVYLSSQSAKPDAVSAYGKTKLEAEAILLAGNVPVTILRPGLVYGAGSHDIFNRMVNIVRKLPVIPLLGGGKAVVQPIHVEDLADAIFRCVDPGVFGGRVLNLGDPDPVSLREFLLRISTTLYGRPKRAVTIPLGPIIPVVTAFESMGVRLPVTRNNLQGLQKVEKMETAASLSELGLVLRPLDEGLRQALLGGKDGRSGGSDAPLDRRAISVALIGTGRIGLMHTATVERQHGMRLGAFVDKNPKAPKFLQAAGFPVKAYTSLGDALAARPLDAAIIATPPRFHLPILKECADRGIAAFIEKPLSRSPENLAEFKEFAAKGNVQAGYLAPSYPQFREALGRLRDGAFGNVTGFEAFSLQSFFPGPKRWEVDPEVSGGGVLINLGGHVLSWIHEAFGLPRAVEARMRSISSERVEDSMVIHLDFDGFSGRYCTSWSIDGFAQAENRLLIDTDRGRLYCANTVAAFVNREGKLEWFRHQADFDLGFNLSPDYIGGALTAELGQFQRMIRAEEEPVMSLRNGIAFEEFLFSVYKKSVPASGFGDDERRHGGGTPVSPVAGDDGADPGNAAAPELVTNGARAGSKDPANPSLRLDLRAVSITPALRRDLAGVDRRWGGFQIAAGQLRVLGDAGVDTAMMTVVVPDFMNYARQLNSGHAVSFLGSLGAKPTFGMGIQAIRSVAAQKGVTFWAVAQSLLAADLARLPGGFNGTILLHSFIADLAASLTRGDLLDAMLKQMRKSRKSAAVGIQTNILREMLNQLASLNEPIDTLQFLSSPKSDTIRATVDQLKASARFQNSRLVAEVGPVPSPLYGEILRAADDWRNGAEAVVVDAVCDPVIARFRRQTLATAWQKAFPGLPFADSAL